MPENSYIKSIIVILCLFFTQVQAGIFSKFSDTVQEYERDSVITVVNPIPDQTMGYNDSLDIKVTSVFSTFPDSYNPLDVENGSLLNSSVYQDTETFDLMISLQSKDFQGHTKITYSANFITDTLTLEEITVKDSFLVKIEDPLLEWYEGGQSYSFDPANCIGTSSVPWRSAQVFDLGNNDYQVMQIEFGYALEDTVDWQIVKFDSIPTDSVTGGLQGSVKAEKAWPVFIENTVNDTITNSIAVVFSSEGNFMSMDPGAKSDNTWIFSEDTGWMQPVDISEDYEGAWYIRLQLWNTLVNSVEEFTSGIPSDHSLKNYPNPFNNKTVLSWEIERPGFVEVNVFNSKGRLVRKLFNKRQNLSKGSAILDCSGLNGGVYFYQLKINGEVKASKKMLYLK